jgi:drug/metabolite transporter (DMT)-like permease
VIAILGGFGAACCWAISTLCSSRSSRMIGAPAVLAWIMLTGFVLLGPFILAEGMPEGVRHNAGWLALAGSVNVLGLLAVIGALGRGKVGIVSAITATEGAVAALIAAAAGEPISILTGVMLALITCGVFLAALAPDHDRRGGASHAAILAAMAAACFGVGLYAAGRVSGSVPAIWASFPARIAGVVAVAVPLAVRGRLRLTKEAAPLVAAAGVCEVVGFIFYVVGARHGIAIAAVLGSQFAAIAAIGAYVLFHERLARLQLAGIAAILAGVATLTALRA